MMQDMLLDEGRRFAERLQGLGKRVDCTIIEGEKHAFDKMPALSLNPKVMLHYQEARVQLNRILGASNIDGDLDLSTL